MNEEFRNIQKYDELEKLLEAKASPENVEDRELAESLQVVHLLSQQHVESAMPRGVEFRKSVIRKIERRSRSWWQVGITLAAALIVGIIWFKPGQDGKNPAGIMMDGEMLEQAFANDARSAMVEYLEGTEKLLVSIRDFDAVCAEDQMNVTQEKEMALRLLTKQREFVAHMNEPQYYQARNLFNQLEKILVDVNSLDLCTDPLEVDLINESIHKKRILRKLRHVAQEIQVS